MPKKHHKGKTRHFTHPDELERDRKQLDALRLKKEEESEEESDENGDEGKLVGHGGLIEVQNPNRIQVKEVKINDLPTEMPSSSQPMSRREREVIEAQQKKEQYDKLHREGKTVEAQADLARLALIRKQREEEERKVLEQKEAKENRTKIAEEQASKPGAMSRTARAKAAKAAKQKASNS